MELIISAYQGDEICVNRIKELTNILHKILTSDNYKQILTKSNLNNDILELYEIINNNCDSQTIYNKIRELWHEISFKSNEVYLYYKHDNRNPKFYEVQ